MDSDNRKYVQRHLEQIEKREVISSDARDKSGGPKMVTRGYAGAPGHQLHYRRSGQGDALVLLSGTPRSSTYYLPLMEHLDDWDVVAIDTPGFGLSDPLKGSWGVHDVAVHIAECLDSLGLQKYSVLGVHAGNKIGTALCSAFPERIPKFLFAGMTHSIILEKDLRNRSMRESYGDPDATNDPDNPAPSDERLLARWAHVQKNLNALWDSYDPTRPDSIAARSAVRHKVLDEVAAFETYDHMYAALFSFDLESALRKLQVPTAIIEMISSEEDHLPRQASLIEAAMPNARSMPIRGDYELLTTRVSEFAGVVNEALKAKI